MMKDAMGSNVKGVKPKNYLSFIYEPMNHEQEVHVAKGMSCLDLYQVHKNPP